MQVNESADGRAAGGAARAARLSSERRSEIARKAAAARWDDVPVAVCGSPDTPLVIGNLAIECYVLEDGTRVITQGSFLRALGRSRTVRRIESEDGLPPIVQGKSLRRFIPDGLTERSQPIPFQLPNKTRALGYNAELLPDVCEAFLAAREAGELPPNQLHVAEQAELIIRGLARVGIIALIDEATGYQDIRTKNALIKILEEFVDRGLQPYLPTFPPDFYKQLFRLRGLDYSTENGAARPQYFGRLTNDIVYRRLAPGVLEELKKVQEKLPSGNPKHRLFQRLTTNVGYPKLREHLGSVVTLMKLSADYDDFKAKLNLLHPPYDAQASLDIDISMYGAGRRRN
jgi:P63C domain